MINITVLQSMLSTTEIKSPSPNQMKTLTLTDLVIMNKLSVSFREQIEKYVDVDPFTTHDPFHENDDYEYSLILDKTNTSRVVSILATKKEFTSQISWDSLLGNQFVRLSISKTEAGALKYELMPKDTNNFYPFRQSTRISGYIMFAYQICGLHQ
ncbi:MAG: hypothetical protein E6L04_00975 [Thaumarchaeota archaeon]|nr:MAG: hypothetical protein E6L04_00975 [Nitrososphaerota archaeon]TLX90159.1 MAG: hypothetical protein E6K97_04105 [Nitrososphaerota archaeon]